MNRLNISIDDVSPHPRSSIKVLDRCFELIERFPEIKFSLFVPISYWRTIKPKTVTHNPLQINLFPEFCDAISALPVKNFEICYHGYYHGIPGRSDNDEFQSIDYNQAIIKFDAMFEVVKLAGLQAVFKKIFRPPAWRMSPNAIKAAKDSGIEVLALSSSEYALKTYAGEDKNFNHVVYDTCAPPFKQLQLSTKTEVVYHACEWDKNYLNIEKCDELSKFIEYNISNIKFSFLKEMI